MAYRYCRFAKIIVSPTAILIFLSFRHKTCLYRILMDITEKCHIILGAVA